MSSFRAENVVYLGYLSLSRTWWSFERYTRRDSRLANNSRFRTPLHRTCNHSSEMREKYPSFVYTTTLFACIAPNHVERITAILHIRTFTLMLLGPPHPDIGYLSITTADSSHQPVDYCALDRSPKNIIFDAVNLPNRKVHAKWS